MKKENELPWECLHNYLPQWAEDLSTELFAVMGKKDSDRFEGLANRFNELTKREDIHRYDVGRAFGIDNEKSDLIDEINKIIVKYRAAAEQLGKMHAIIDEEDKKSHTYHILHGDKFNPRHFGFKKDGYCWKGTFEMQKGGNWTDVVFDLDETDEDGYTLSYKEGEETIWLYNGIIPSDDFFTLIKLLCIRNYHPRKSNEE